jgi:MFS family permease
MFSRSLSNRLLIVLFISQSLFSAAQIAVFTLVAIVAVRLNGSESVAGLPSSTLTFSQALFALPIAILMGRFGRRFGLSLGYAVGALGALIGIIAIAQSLFPLLLVSAALLGMARGSSEQARFVVGEIFPEAERARMIGRLIFAGTVGAVAGPVLVAPSGHLMEALGLHPDIGAWVAAFVLCLLAALLIFLLLRPDPMSIAKVFADAEQRQRSNEFEQPTRSLWTLLMLPKVQLAVLAVLISQTVMVVLMVMTPLYMDHHHHSRDSISLVISMHTLGMFGLSPVTGYLVDRSGRIPMLLAAAATLITSALLAPLSTNQFILAAALFLLGLGWNFGYVSGTSLLADALQGTERARVQGVNDSLVFLAAGFASLGAGPLFASGGYSAVSAAGLILCFVLISLIFWYGYRSRQELSVESV